MSIVDQNIEDITPRASKRWHRYLEDFPKYLESGEFGKNITELIAVKMLIDGDSLTDCDIECLMLNAISDKMYLEKEKL